MQLPLLHILGSRQDKNLKLATISPLDSWIWMLIPIIFFPTSSNIDVWLVKYTPATARYCHYLSTGITAATINPIACVKHKMSGVCLGREKRERTVLLFSIYRKLKKKSEMRQSKEFFWFLCLWNEVLRLCCFRKKILLIKQKAGGIEKHSGCLCWEAF